MFILVYKIIICFNTFIDKYILNASHNASYFVFVSALNI